MAEGRGLSWEAIRQELQASTVQRLKGLELFKGFLQRHNLDRVEVGELMDLSATLLADNNSKVAQQTLEALDTVVQQEKDGVRPFANVLIPRVVERLGDSRQAVREKALQVLVSVFKVLRPELVFEKLTPYWQHRNWKVKHGLLQAVAEAVSKDGASVLGSKDQNHSVLKQVIKMVEEPDVTVRDAALECLVEIHNHMPNAVLQLVQSSGLRSAQQKEVIVRLRECYPPGGQQPTDGAVANSTPQHSRRPLDGLDAADGVTSPQHGLGLGSSFGSYDRTSSSNLDDSAIRPDTKQRASANGSCAAAVAAAPAPSVAKRGGFRDGGGVTADGEMPPVVPVPVTSERELRSELDAVIAILAQAPNADWLQRMAAMVRVEALILGGAAEFDAFFDAVKSLTSVLSQQFKERRSTIARQACHLIGILATTLGQRFEANAVAILPTLFGVLVITIQVMAEAADLGVRTILQHCQGGRVLQILADFMCKDKNPKVRQFGATYLQVILEEWEPAVWGRHLDVVEACIKFGAGDTTGEARNSTRMAFQAYKAGLPDRAQSFLKRQDASLQDKLTMKQGAAKATGKAVGARQFVKAALASRPAPSSFEEVVIVAPVARPRERQVAQQPQAGLSTAAGQHAAAGTAADRTGSVSQRGPYRSASGSSTSSAASAAAAAAAMAALEPAAPEPSVPRRVLPANGRKSMGLPPGRIPGGSLDLTNLLPEASTSSVTGVQSNDVAGRAVRLPSRRQSDVPPRMPGGGPDAPRRVPAATPPVQGPAYPMAAWLAAPPSVVDVAGPADAPAAPQAEVSVSSTFSVGAALVTGSSLAQPPVHRGHREGFGSSAGSSSSGYEPPAAAAAAPKIILSRAVPLQRVVATLAGGPRTWSDKVEAFTALSSSLHAAAAGELEPHELPPGGAAGVARELEKVRERLLEALDDPHAKVLSSALEAVRDVVRHHPRVFEAQLDRLLPTLFCKGVEVKEHVRQLCADLLSECCTVYRPEAVLPVLTKCLEVQKVHRARNLVLDAFMATVMGGGPDAAPPPVNAGQIRQWLLRMAPLLDDKDKELRHKANSVLAAMWEATWPREHIQYVAIVANYGTEVAALRRAFHALMPAPPATSYLGTPAAAWTGMAVHGTGPGGAAVGASSSAAQYDGHAGASGPPGSAGRQGRPPSAPPPTSATLRGSPARAMHSADGTGAEAQLQEAWAHQALSSPFMSAAAAGGAPPHAVAHVAAPIGQAGDGVAAWLRADPHRQVLHLGKAMEQFRVAGPHLGSAEWTHRISKLAECADSCGLDIWKSHSPPMMVHLSNWLEGDMAAETPAVVQEMCFSLLLQLLKHHPQLFADSGLTLHMNMLLKGTGHANSQVRVAAGHALKQYLAHCSPQRALMYIAAALPGLRDTYRKAGRPSEPLVTALESVRSLAQRMSRRELEMVTFNEMHEHQRKNLLEVVASNIDDATIGVRKTATTVLAELWFRIGHRVRNVVQMVVPTAQQTLIAIYFLKHHGLTVPANSVAMEHEKVVENYVPPDGESLEGDDYDATTSWDSPTSGPIPLPANAD